MVVIICYYKNVERKYIFIAFFILSIISNILTITITWCNYNYNLVDLHTVSQLRSYVLSHIKQQGIAIL